MAIPRATTPTITLTFTDATLDLTEAANVYVTLEQFNKTMTKTGEDLTVQAKQIELFLDQEETLKFAEGDAHIQANWVTPTGRRACSDVQTIQISKQLLKEVIE